jgi:hypothetical protein
MICIFFIGLLSSFNTGNYSPPFTIVSWWPLMSTWRKNVSLNWWTEQFEKFYENRLKELESGTAVPLTQRQWRSKIRSNSLADRVVLNNDRHSLAFLNTVVDGQYPGLYYK